MKTKLVAVLFAVVIAGLAVVFYFSKNKSDPEVTVTNQAKIVNPKYKKETQTDVQINEDNFETESFTSLVDLAPTETLISTLVCDLDGDTYDDQIVVVRKADSRYLFVVVGIYNTESKRYERIADIDTGIGKTGTFAYSVLDVIGNHSQALIYQGYDDKDDYILNIFLCNKNENDVELLNIGTFESDGTVFVQQTERSESYELAISNGESFSVWVYSSDKKEAEEGDSNPPKQNAGLNQIQAEYKWNPLTMQYEFSRSTTVSAGHLAAKELSRIQDGTVETFADFMEGLWYKTSNTDNTIRYLYFNYADKEVIFLSDDAEESYVWEDSKLRHNGIFLTTSNSIITSLVRRFLITLVNVDEVRISVRDEISMNISESSLWDGSYKKTPSSYTFGNEDPYKGVNEFSAKITVRQWQEDENITLSFDGVKYSAGAGEAVESGVYSIFKVADDFVVQFRPLSDYRVLEKEYMMVFGTKVIEETVKKKKVEKIVVDEDSLIFTPVKITPTEVFLQDGKVIDFKAIDFKAVEQ